MAERASIFEDGLDNYTIESIKNATNLETWRKYFILRFFHQLEIQKLKKSDVCNRVNSNVDNHKLISDDFHLARNTLTDLTNYKKIIENNNEKLRNLHINQLIAISKALNVSIDYLLGITDAEFHGYGEINEILGLNDKEISILKDNEHAKKQLSFFLKQDSFEKLTRFIEHEKLLESCFKGIKAEFSENLWYLILKSFKKLKFESHPLEYSIDTYQKYLKENLYYQSKLNVEKLLKYINANTSNIYINFSELENKKCNKEELFDKFILEISNGNVTNHV